MSLSAADSSFSLRRPREHGTQCVSFAEGCCSSFSCDGMPGVARRLLTFFASPKKVSKERRPQVRRPAKAPGSLRCSQTRAAAELGLVALSSKRFSLCSPSDSPRGLPPRLLRCSAPLMGTLCRNATTGEKIALSPRSGDPSSSTSN